MPNRKTVAFSVLSTILACSLSLFVGELVVRKVANVRNVGPSFSTYDKEFGKHLKVNFSTQRVTPEFRMRFSTNSLGFRGPEPARHGPTILFVGDSFTMGYGVDDGEEFPELIRREIHKLGWHHRVINAGIGDVGTGRWLKFLQKYGETYKPSVIVIQIHKSDFIDNLREKLFQLKQGGELVPLPLSREPWQRKVQTIIESIPGLADTYLIGLLRQVNFAPKRVQVEFEYNDHGRRTFGVQNGDALTVRLLQEIIELCAAKKWPLIALLIDLEKKQLRKVESLFSSKDIATVTMPSKSDRPELYYKIDGHWNAAGHALAANRLLKQLMGNLETSSKRMPIK